MPAFFNLHCLEKYRAKVGIKWFVWPHSYWSHSKKNLSFLYTLFWTNFIVKKRHHRNKYLGLLILNLYATLRILIHKQQHDAYTQHQTFFSNFLLLKPKGTSNKFVPEIF